MDARALFRKAKKDRGPVATPVKVRVKPIKQQAKDTRPVTGGLKGLSAYVETSSQSAVTRVKKRTDVSTTHADSTATATPALATPSLPPSVPSVHQAGGANGSGASESIGSVVPEGFYDDKKKDAKVRHVPVKDDLADDYVAFQKSVAVKQEKSEKAEAYDDDVAATRRLVAEVQEQESHMARLRVMKTKYDARKKVKIEQYTAPVKAKQEVQEDDDDDGDDDDDEDNWRARGVF